MTEIALVFISGAIVGIVLVCVIKRIINRKCRPSRPLEYPADFPNAKMTDADSLSEEDRDALFKHHI